MPTSYSTASVIGVATLVSRTLLNSRIIYAQGDRISFLLTGVSVILFLAVLFISISSPLFFDFFITFFIEIRFMRCLVSAAVGRALYV